MSAEQRIKELGIALPAGSAPAANYANAVRTGNLLFIAGKAPLPENGKLPKGRVNIAHHRWPLMRNRRLPGKARASRSGHAG